MTIKAVFQVIDRNDKVIGEFMDKKLADILDKRTDVMYALSDKMTAKNPGPGLSDEKAEKLAEWLMDDRKDIVDLLKKVRDMPDSTSSASEDSKDSNVIALDKAS